MGTLLSNGYTMACPPVRGDNPQTLAGGLSCVQVNKHGITILYHLNECRPCTSHDIIAKGWYKGGYHLIIFEHARTAA